MFLTAFCTVLVNIMLQVFMDRLAVMERHSSLTSQQRGVTSRLFIGLFLNTGVIILIVNANLAPYVGDTIFRSILPGKFSEFEPDWFYSVGVSILLTMFVNAFNPHLMSLLTVPWDKFKRNKCAKRAKNQNALNELYAGRRFVLAERYSVMLNTVFVVLTFSSGMPILWLVGAFTFTLTYWMDKTTFLRNYRIPLVTTSPWTNSPQPSCLTPSSLTCSWLYGSTPRR